MASYYTLEFDNAHANLENHLRKINEIVDSYIADNRKQRRIHFDAVAVCLRQYESDLKAECALDAGGEKFVELLNLALTELKGYFLKAVEESFGSVYIKDESEAVIFAYFLEKGTLELRNAARPTQDEAE